MADNDRLIEHLVKRGFAKPYEYAGHYMYEIPGNFGVRVEVTVEDLDDNPIEPEYRIALSHQCDAWEIAEDTDANKVVRETADFMHQVMRARVLVEEMLLWRVAGVH